MKKCKILEEYIIESLQDIPHIHELIIMHAECPHNIEEKRLFREKGLESNFS